MANTHLVADDLPVLNRRRAWVPHGSVMPLMPESHRSEVSGGAGRVAGRPFMGRVWRVVIAGIT